MTAGLAVTAAAFLSSGTLAGRPSRSLRGFIRLAPVAIAPLLIGAASFAFLYRDTGPFLYEVAGESRGTLTAILLVSVAQVLRYGPLLLWLCLLALLHVPSEKREYARQVGFSGREHLRTEVIGLWLAPVLVVLAFVFQDAANDRLILHLALRPSVATHTELLPHMMDREFFVLLSLRSPAFAINTLVTVGLAATASFVILFGILAALCIGLFRAVKSPKFDFRSTRTSRESLAGSPGLWPAFLFVSLVLVLFAFALVRLEPGNFVGLLPLFESGMISMAAAGVGWLIAAPLVFGVRENLTADDGKAGRVLGVASIVAVGVGFVPPLALAIAVLGLAYFTDIQGGGSSGVWLFLTEFTRFTPIIFVLLVPLALSIPDAMIAYLKSAGVSWHQQFRLAFLSPNRMTHLAVTVICFDLIINEGVISSIFQGDIPSLPDMMVRATTGRSANYSLAGLLVIAQAVAFTVALALWGRSAAQRWKTDAN